MTPAGSDRAQLLELASQAASSCGDSLRAVSLLEEAISLHSAGGDADAVGRCTAQMAGALSALRRFAEAIERAREAFEHGSDLDERVRADLAVEIGFASYMSGQNALGLEWTETALILAERHDDRSLLARAIGAKSALLFQLGRHREAVILARGMAVLAEEGGAQREKARALLSLSVYTLEDDLREALSASVEAAELARRIGLRAEELVNLLNAAETSVYVGDWERTRRAIAELEQRDLDLEQRTWFTAVKAVLAASTDDPEGGLALIGSLTATTDYIHIRSTLMCTTSNVLLATGDLQGARSRAAEGVAADPMGINAPLCLSVEGRACLWQGDVTGAKHVCAALESFRGRWAGAVRLTLEAGVAGLEGDRARARASYSASFEAWRALDCPLSLAMAGLDHVIVLGPKEDPAVTGETEAILTELGSRPFLERLRAQGAVR